MRRGPLPSAERLCGCDGEADKPEYDFTRRPPVEVLALGGERR